MDWRLQYSASSWAFKLTPFHWESCDLFAYKSIRLITFQTQNHSVWPAIQWLRYNLNFRHRFAVQERILQCFAALYSFVACTTSFRSRPNYANESLQYWTWKCSPSFLPLPYQITIDQQMQEQKQQQRLLILLKGTEMRVRWAPIHHDSIQIRSSHVVHK